MIKYKGKFESKDTCVCIIDDTDKYNSWTKELVKHRADYTISNCTGMGYDVFVGRNVNSILKSISNDYNVAVIISPATEFINGDSFFKNIPNDFSLIGHVLDAGEGYYTLHPQCYVLNLEIFNLIGKPELGEQKYFQKINTTKPIRSDENIHDDYTPLFIKPGNNYHQYKHSYNGWNLIKNVLENNLSIDAFGENLRNNKHYLYRDVNTSAWIYQRYNYCLSKHVYTANTGEELLPVVNTPIKNLIIPAAGKNWLNTIEKFDHTSDCCIKFYDYSVAALDWIKQQTENIDIKFEYHQIDILHQPEEFLNLVDSNSEYIEFSNIFCYEATAALIPLKHRLEIQNQLINGISTINENCWIHFDQKSEDGFINDVYSTQQAKNITVNLWEDLNLPPWNTYS